MVPAMRVSLLVDAIEDHELREKCDTLTLPDEGVLY
jgi:hypothetical protein